MGVEHTVKAPDQEASDFANSLLDSQGDVDAYGERDEATDEVAEEAAEADDELDAGAEAEGDSGSDQDADEGTDEDESGDLRFVEIEIDGKKYEVPEELKDGYLMQADYTKKTQALSDYRKEVEIAQKQLTVQQAENQFIAEIQPEINNLGYLQAQVKQIEQDMQQNLSSMTSEDMFRKKIQADGLKEQAAALKAQLEAKYGEFQNTQEQAYTELLNKGAEILKQTIPDWTPDKQKELREFALGQGLTEQEVNSIIDPRHVRILYNAAQYEKLQGKAPQAAEKVNTRIKQKASNPMPKDTRRKLDMRKKLKSNKTSADEKANIIGEQAADWFFNAKG